MDIRRSERAILRGRAFGAAVAVMALLFAACQPAPTVAPETVEPVATGPATTASPTVAASTPPAVETPVALLEDDPGPPTTAAGKIQAAVASGELDGPTGYLYRVFAVFGDPRLPDAYAGEPSEDLGLFDALQADYAGLPTEIQEQVLPYVVRPSDPTSFWNQEPAAPAVAGARLRGPQPPTRPHAQAPLARSCVNGWISDRVSTSIPIKIWAHCGGSAATADAQLEEARGYLTSLWLPETNLMGLPIGDRNFPNDGYTDLPEAGDGLIDFYLLSNRTPAGHVRDMSLGTAYGATSRTPPIEGPAGAERTSAYVVVKPGLTGLILKSTLAHEFFHVLQASHNRGGTFDCPATVINVGCNVNARHHHWFVEASAAWSEHYFVPEARDEVDGPYPLWREFVKTLRGLSFTDGRNEYVSWTWPLFMQQESTEDAIGNAWRNLRGEVGWWEVQRSLDSELSFEGRFDDYAVRVLNQTLDGNPINPRFKVRVIAPNFPDDIPEEPRSPVAVLEDLIEPLVAPTTRYSYTIRLSSLFSAYLPIVPPPGARTLRFEFAAFAPEIEIDAIVKVGDIWERRELPAGETVWCLDDPKDAVEQGYLIFSNHDQVPGAITRPWSITAEEAGCGLPVGTLRYSFLDTTPMPYAGSSHAEDATVQVRLKLAPPDSPFAAMYLNDGSTYGAQTSTHAVLPPGVDGCSPSATSTGTPGGNLAADSVVGNLLHNDDGTLSLYIAISLPIHVETDEDWCALGSAHRSSETTLQYPDCEGKESTAAATSSTKTFVFDCDFQGGSAASNVSGTLILDMTR